MFSEPPGSVGQRLGDVFRFEVRICAQDLFGRVPCSQKTHNHADRDPHTTNACLAAHDSGIESNPVEGSHRLSSLDPCYRSVQPVRPV